MPKNTLTITRTEDDGSTSEIVRVEIGEVDPLDAALITMTALKNSQPKGRRSDYGTKRPPKTAEVPA